MSTRHQEIEAQYEALKAHIESLAPETIKPYQDRAFETDQCLNEWAQDGNAIGLYIGTQLRPELVDQRDGLKQNALHHAAGDHSGLMTRILTDQPTTAIYERDFMDRTPLELAGEQRNRAAEDILFSLSYPDLHQQPELRSDQGDEPMQARLQGYEALRQSEHAQPIQDKSHDRDRD